MAIFIRWWTLAFQSNRDCEYSGPHNQKGVETCTNKSNAKSIKRKGNEGRKERLVSSWGGHCSSVRTYCFLNIKVFVLSVVFGN
jgi:hypothetical protein